MKVSAAIIAKDEADRIGPCLESLSFVDEIVVLESGRIVERGRHTELLERDGVYGEMWRRQQEATPGGEASLGAEPLAAR